MYTLRINRGEERVAPPVSLRLPEGQPRRTSRSSCRATGERSKREILTSTGIRGLSGLQQETAETLQFLIHLLKINETIVEIGV